MSEFNEQLPEEVQIEQAVDQLIKKWDPEIELAQEARKRGREGEALSNGIIQALVLLLEGSGITEEMLAKNNDELAIKILKAYDNKIEQ